MNLAGRAEGEVLGAGHRVQQTGTRPRPGGHPGTGLVDPEHAPSGEDVVAELRSLTAKL
jgi:hypothetical protein